MQGKFKDMQLFPKEGPFVNVVSENTHLCTQKLQKDLPQTTVAYCRATIDLYWLAGDNGLMVKFHWEHLVLS